MRFTEWVDIMVFNFDGSYLLQGRKHKKTKATQFRVVKPKNCLDVVMPMNLTEEHLKKAGLWN
jgi:hypothetical protein